MTRTTITLAAAVLAIVGAALAFTPKDDDPEPVPLTIWICCESDGSHCVETSPAACSPAKDLVACCGPATEGDGTVSCGC